MCGGFLMRKTLWLPSWKGWLLLFGLLVLAGLGAVRGIHPFLALDQRVPSDLLVVEGWVPDYALKQGLDFSVDTHCRYLLLTGGLVSGAVEPEPEDTYGRIALQRLKNLGGETGQVRVVDSPAVMRDRTFSSAVAVRDWLAAEGMAPKSITVLTLGTHARRSRLLFQKAFGAKVEVGIISVPDREYDARIWWRSSEGVKEVLSEGAAYLYARFLFSAG